MQIAEISFSSVGWEMANNARCPEIKSLHGTLHFGVQRYIIFSLILVHFFFTNLNLLIIKLINNIVLGTSCIQFPAIHYTFWYFALKSNLKSISHKKQFMHFQTFNSEVWEEVVCFVDISCIVVDDHCLFFLCHNDAYAIQAMKKVNI